VKKINKIKNGRDGGSKWISCSQKQCCIESMEGKARAMGATLMGAQKLPNVKICNLLLLQPVFCAPYNH